VGRACSAPCNQNHLCERRETGVLTLPVFIAFFSVDTTCSKAQAEVRKKEKCADQISVLRPRAMHEQAPSAPTQ
jgi:hypothetical protein